MALNFVCMKQIEIEEHATLPEEEVSVLTGDLAYPLMPVTNDFCDGTCPPIVVPSSSSEDESSCDDSDITFGADGTCRTSEVCGTRDVLNLETGRTHQVIEVCAPRCPDMTTIWDPETETCVPIIPPLSCEDKLIPHIERESEVETRYWLQ